MLIHGRTIYEGKVEDVSDPKQMGRVRVRVYGPHTDSKVDIPTEDLPWALVATPTTSPAISGIGEHPYLHNGSVVLLYFRDGDDMQQPVVIATLGGIPEEAATPSQGFNDPDGVFPRADRLGEPDVNRLARGDKSDSVHDTKDQNRKTGVSKASGGSWDEPANPYGAEYPNNHVFESTSGHTTEIDDTPGAERLHRSHRTGTGEEIHPDGSRVQKVVMDNYTIVLGSDNVYIEGECNIFVGGATNITSGGKVTVQAPEVDIGTDGPEPIVLGDEFADWLLRIVKVWLDSHTHYGNLGFPTSPAAVGATGPFEVEEAAKGGAVYSDKNRSQ